MVINNKWGKNKTEVLRPQVLQQDLISKTVNRRTGNSSVKTRSEVKANQYNNIYTSKCMMTTGFCRNGYTKYMEYLCACQIKDPNIDQKSLKIVLIEINTTNKSGWQPANV